MLCVIVFHFGIGKRLLDILESAQRILKKPQSGAGLLIKVGMRSLLHLRKAKEVMYAFIDWYSVQVLTSLLTT